MVNPNFPCSQGNCDRTQSLVSSKLCNDIGETLLKAGAAGFFEASPCPIDVLKNLVNADETHETIAGIRKNLGIKSIESTNYDELD